MKPLFAFVLIALLLLACGLPSIAGDPAPITAHPTQAMTPVAQAPALSPTPPVSQPGGARPTPQFNPFQALTLEQEACLRAAWGDEAFQAITTFERPPTQDEQPAMDACGLLKPGGPGEGGQPGGGAPGQGQPGGPGNPVSGGPYTHQVMLAASTDGLNWTAEDEVVRDHGSVPEIVRLSDSVLMIYFVNGETDTTDAIRQTSGGTWEELDLSIGGMPSQKAWDPDAVRLPDGRLRLYFFGPPQSAADMSAPHTIYSAVSSDGLSFEAEAGERITVGGVTDPSVVILPDGSWFMALSRGEETLLARSPDGLSFTETGVAVTLGGVPELFVLKDGSLRLFVTGNGIQSLISNDGGETWTEEPGPRLSAQGNIAADPSVIQLSESSWLMAWKRIDPAVLQSQGGGPKPTPKP